MKKIIIFLFSAILVLLPVYSYSLVDLGAFGGYQVSNDHDEDNPRTTRDKSVQYGAFGHYTIGLGYFYVGAGLFYEHHGKSPDIIVDTLAAEAILSLAFPMIPISPFGKAGISLLDNFHSTTNRNVLMAHVNEQRSLNSIHFAAGLAVQVMPLLSIYGEYAHQKFNTLRKKSFSITNNAGNVGVRFNL